MDKTRLSKYISYILRHHPEAAGVTLDEHGWADTDELIAGVSKRYPITRELLEEIVRTDGKQRYAFSADGKRIRANHGHTVQIDLDLPPAEPPEFLYHGTAEQYVASIREHGLLPQRRVYVHLTTDRGTAIRVGRRHGEPVLYRVHSGRMYADGYLFRMSANGVWFADAVPPGYLELVEITEDGI